MFQALQSSPQKRQILNAPSLNEPSNSSVYPAQGTSLLSSSEEKEACSALPHKLVYFLKYRINLKLIFHICQFQPQLQLFPYARTKFKITVCIFGLSEMQTEAKFASQAAASCLPGIDDARVHPGPG